METNANINKGFFYQFPRNLIANIVYFIISVIIGIILVPYFISNLGVAAYGLIPLAATITGYVGFIVQSLNTAVSRFLTVDLQKEDYISANKTFNSAVFGLTAIILVMIPGIIVIAYFIPQIFSVPVGQENGAVFLFLGVCAALLIRSWSGNFTVQLFAYNRLDLQNIVNATNLFVQTGLIFIFFKLYGPSLAFVGLAYLSGAVFASVVAIILARRISPHLKLSLNSIDLLKIKEMGSMSWWAIVDQIGALLLLGIDLIVVNMLFGATSAGEYAVALQWVVLLKGTATMIAGVFTPMIFTYYAKDQIETLTKMAISAVKSMGLLIAFPIGFICGFAPQILSLWVGEGFKFLAPLMIILLIHNVINLAVLPLFSINVAYNRLRLPGIVTLVSGVLNLVLAIALATMTGWGYYGVAIAGAIVLTFKNIVFTPWYITKVSGIKTSSIVTSVLPGIISTLILVIIGLTIGTFVPITSLLSLFIIGGLLGLIYVALIWQFILSSFERQIVLSYLPKSLSRIV